MNGCAKEKPLWFVENPKCHRAEAERSILALKNGKKSKVTKNKNKF